MLVCVLTYVEFAQKYLKLNLSISLATEHPLTTLQTTNRNFKEINCGGKDSTRKSSNRI